MSVEPREIILLSQAKKAIVESKSIHEVKSMRDKAAAVRMYLKQQNESLEIQNEAAEIKIRAERRAGELLADMEKSEGGRPVKTADIVSVVSPPKLSELGIAHKQSERWQKVAT